MQTLETKKKGIVTFFLKKGLLVNSDLLNYLEDEKNLSNLAALVENTHHKDIMVLSEKIKCILGNKENSELNWLELEKIKAISEKKGKDDNSEVLDQLIGYTKKSGVNEEKTDRSIKIVVSYNTPPKGRDANDFVEYFNQRYQALEKILKNRQELRNTTSISRIASKRDREQVAAIGLVQDKQYTKTGNCMLNIEDKTGCIKVLISKNKPDLFKAASDIVLDEVIGVVGSNGDKIIFASSILSPDIPLTNEIKKCEEEAYAIFLSDIHVGSNHFLEEDFNKFLKWINGDLGNPAQRQIVSKIKYIFIMGDLVDGCGVYPGQEKELTIKDITGQYDAFTELISKIPKDIKIIISPGNHDAMRLAEPQLPIYKDFSEKLYSLPNVSMVSNPSIINIHSSATFPGFDVLMYHGYSFDYYVSEVDSIRNKGGYDRADLLMKFLLQKRHLAPSYTSTLYVPDIKSDFLAIEKIPDFFVSGHIHKAAAANYKGVTLICGSCWQSKTAFQEKVGHNPEPSRVPIVNLQTRQIKMLKFGK